MNTPDPARATGSVPAVAPEPDAAPDAGTRPLPEAHGADGADAADPFRPGDSVGVPAPARAPLAPVPLRTAA